MDVQHKADLLKDALNSGPNYYKITKLP